MPHIRHAQEGVPAGDGRRVCWFWAVEAGHCRRKRSAQGDVGGSRSVRHIVAAVHYQNARQKHGSIEMQPRTKSHCNLANGRGKQYLPGCVKSRAKHDKYACSSAGRRGALYTCRCSRFSGRATKSVTRGRLPIRAGREFVALLREYYAVNLPTVQTDR